MIYKENDESHVNSGKFKPIEYEEKNGCWECTSHTRNTKGYPMVRRNGKLTTISRYVYEDFNGTTLGSLLVRHKCDNPSCINPKHLESGTHSENMRDKVERGRSKFYIGERHHLSVLDEEKVREIKVLLMEGELTLTEIGRRYGVSDNSIRNIKLGKSWRNVKI